MVRKKSNPYVGRFLAAVILLAAGVALAADDAVFVNAAGGLGQPVCAACVAALRIRFRCLLPSSTASCNACFPIWRLNPCSGISSARRCHPCPYRADSQSRRAHSENPRR
jgi:hypothetical protein